MTGKGSGVGDWQKAARERLKALEMAEHALGKAVARDSAQRLGVPNCVVDRRRPQFASERQKAFRVAGGVVAVAAGRVLMAEPAATVEAANKLGLFLVGQALHEGKDDKTKSG